MMVCHCLGKYLHAYTNMTKIIQLIGRGQLYHNLWMYSPRELCCDIHCVVSVQGSMRYVRGSYSTIIIWNICNRNKYGNENICFGHVYFVLPSCCTLYGLNFCTA
jgi:hypothetical protein